MLPRSRSAISALLLGALAALPVLAAEQAAAPAPPATAAAPVDLHPRLLVETTRGNFVLELDAERAPLTVANFMKYVADGHYAGTIFHRVIPGFVVQGGGYREDYSERKTRAPVPNESGNGLSNRRGTIGLARQGDPHSGTSQWYINLVDNTGLDPLPSRWGYAVFGRVVQGFEVLDGISLTPTGPGGPFPADVPREKILVTRIGPPPVEPPAPAAAPAAPAAPTAETPPPAPPPQS